VSSSGTRLTNEFRYLLDMIILVVSAGWVVPRRCDSRRVTGRGQGSAGRPTAQRRGLDAGTGRQADRAAAWP
jgi:hypothetical protein